MKRVIKASSVSTSQCSFDFDLGHSYNANYIEDEICGRMDDLGYEVTGVDFHAVDYPEGKQYSQCSFDFRWWGSYDADAIENTLIDLIDDEGGNFLGIDFYGM